MKLTSDNDTLAENKVLILYILNKLNSPINNDALMQLVILVQDMNYFYFQQFLLDLLENKYITEKDSLYEITELGKETLKLTEDLLPGIIKFRIDNNIKEELDEIKNEVAVSSEFFVDDDNNFLVKCKLVENNTTIFEISTFAGSRDQAKIISDNWEQNANDLYPKMMNLLVNPSEKNCH